jgi:hypothetical protein
MGRARGGQIDVGPGRTALRRAGRKGAVGVLAVGGTLQAIASGDRSIHDVQRWVEAMGLEGLLVESLNGAYFAVRRAWKDG